MEKTTVYIPGPLKRRLAKVAERRGVSEAQVIRDGIERAVSEDEPPRPHLSLFASGDATLAERLDDELSRGFGRP